MGIGLSEIAEGSYIVLHISNADGSLDMGANLLKHVKDKVALIDLNYESNQRINFDNVQIEMEYSPEDGIPLVWHGVKIINYKNNYILQVSSDGFRHNRRNSFRIPVAKTAIMKMKGRGTPYVLVKDVSVSGFSITDRPKELNLSIGDQLSVSFEDLGYQIDLDGRVVRIEEREDMIIYGLVICNLCRNLTPYINLKQLRNRSKQKDKN